MKNEVNSYKFENTPRLFILNCVNNHIYRSSNDDLYLTFPKSISLTLCVSIKTSNK